MLVNIEFVCPVSVVVDTETGKVSSVHVWDMSMDISKPVAFHDDGNDHAPIEPSSNEARKALGIANDPGVEYPAWQFDA